MAFTLGHLEGKWNMHIESLVQTEYPALGPGTTLDVALDYMRERGCDYVYVLKEGRPMGFVTLSDIFRKTASRHLDVKNLALMDVMVHRVHWFYSDWDSVVVANELAQRTEGHALVCDRDGLVIGAVELLDLLAWNETGSPRIGERLAAR